MIYIVKEARQSMSSGEDNGKAGNGGEGRQNGNKSAIARGNNAVLHTLPKTVFENRSGSV
jgi:hypothetical protein